jgi:uncharacterized protein (TIGR02646 family)
MLTKEEEIELAWLDYSTVGALRSRGPRVRERLSAEQNHRCCYCGVRTNEPGAPSPTIEHVRPRRHGGNDAYSNLVMACQPCNQKRGDKPLALFIEGIRSNEASR